MNIQGFNNKNTTNDSRIRGEANGYGIPAGAETFRGHLTDRMGSAGDRNVLEYSTSDDPDDPQQFDEDPQYERNGYKKAGRKGSDANSPDTIQTAKSHTAISKSHMKDAAFPAEKLTVVTQSGRKETLPHLVNSATIGGKLDLSSSADQLSKTSLETVGDKTENRNHSHIVNGGGSTTQLPEANNGHNWKNSRTSYGPGANLRVSMQQNGEKIKGSGIPRIGDISRGFASETASDRSGTDFRNSQKTAMSGLNSDGVSTRTVVPGRMFTADNMRTTGNDKEAPTSPGLEERSATVRYRANGNSINDISQSQQVKVNQRVQWNKTNMGGQTVGRVSRKAGSAGIYDAGTASTASTGSKVPGDMQSRSSGSQTVSGAVQATVSDVRMQAEWTAASIQGAHSGSGAESMLTGDNSKKGTQHSNSAAQAIQRVLSSRMGAGTRTDLLTFRQTGRERNVFQHISHNNYFIEPDWAETENSLSDREVGRGSTFVKLPTIEARPNVEMTAAGRTSSFQGHSVDVRKEALPVLVKTMEEQIRSAGGRENRIANYKLMFEDGRSLGMSIRKSAEGIRIVLNSRDQELNRFMEEHAEEITRLLKEKFEIEVDFRFSGQELATTGGHADMDGRNETQNSTTDISNQKNAGTNADGTSEENTNETVVRTGYNLFHWTA